MSDQIEKPCSLCRHSENIASEAQRVCLHPNITSPSAISGKPIGMDAEMVRYKYQRMSRDLCGPSGRWWEKLA